MIAFRCAIPSTSRSAFLPSDFDVPDEDAGVRTGGGASVSGSPKAFLSARFMLNFHTVTAAVDSHLAYELREHWGSSCWDLWYLLHVLAVAVAVAASDWAAVGHGQQLLVGPPHAHC